MPFINPSEVDTYSSLGGHKEERGTRKNETEREEKKGQ